MSTVQQLYRLQELEAEVESLEQKIARIKTELADSRELDNAKNNLKREEERFSELSKKQRSTEWELADCENKIAAAEKDLYGGRIGNPKELANLQRDVDSLKQKRSQFEDGALGLMEEAEASDARVLACQKELERVQRACRERRDRLLQELERFQGELAERMKQRQPLLEGIAPEVAERYYLVKRQKGLAVAKIERGICLGCRISVPAREIQKARGNQLVQCSSCGRFLFMP